MKSTNPIKLSSILLIINLLEFTGGIAAILTGRAQIAALFLLLVSLNILFLQFLTPEEPHLSVSIPDDEVESCDDVISHITEELAAQVENIQAETASSEEEPAREPDSDTPKEPEEPQKEAHFFPCPLTASVPIALSEFFEQFQQLHKNMLKAKQIRFQVQIENASLRTSMSESALMLICGQLLDNSLKYTAANDQIFVTATRADDQIMIIWKDSGSGLSASETEHVFDMNYQGSNRICGSGLGLFQAACILDASGGSYFAKSSLEKGFTIYMTLPTLKGAANEI